MILLALLTVAAPFVGWEASGRTMPHDEIVLIGLSCLTFACAVHDAALEACLKATRFSGGARPRIPPLRLPGDDGSDAIAPSKRPAGPTHWQGAPAFAAAHYGGASAAPDDPRLYEA